MVKRIWTPSFAVFSAGWSLLLLAFFYGVIDLRRRRRWAFMFVVAGMNPIALYCMSMLMKPWIRDAPWPEHLRHFQPDIRAGGRDGDDPSHPLANCFLDVSQENLPAHLTIPPNGAEKAFTLAKRSGLSNSQIPHQE
ncbi:MAG TPA: hypothetical protein VFD27_23165 [Chthoniobacteraceae bacterium]|jgi:hypothetical protein|nr:hypothetical protein [Chthoniobacteraceae bacterium]